MRFILAFVTVLLASPALACELMIGEDRGGVIKDYEARFEHYESTGCTIRMHGLKLSSATMFLGLSRGCIEPGTLAIYHGPSWGGHEMESTHFEYWKDRVSQRYPAPIQRWYRANVTDHKTLWTIRYDELVRVGVAACPK